MELIKNLFKRTVLIIVLISILITFLATPASYAELGLEDDEFYYAGTTEGSYVPTFNIFAWLINNLGDIADWILGIITMGFRMVFVGWTALLEKALTWALESTTGVSADGSIVDSSTDMTGLTDSSNNITVEAIVYNKVAGFNIDFFDLEFDRSITGTGKKLVCEHCNKYVAEYEGEEQSGCIPNTEAEAIKSDAENIKEAISKGDYDFAQHCTCECNGCDDCAKYVKQLVADKPIVIKIRELVATWYSIIRFLAMAAMLVILIAIGIKMALSTIASDKAVYKRMLVDWVVGVIILFAIHYFMIFCIHMNGVLVKTVEDSAQSINQVQMQQLFGDEEGVSNAELEVRVYEEVRTRAYDARLINGMTGMIMYMTLVFFAFKYTLIYLKRYLTILVLTLMGPAVGVAYALQKALSGKSSALSTWMKEYIMNVIIQIVHALLYAVFISQAMILSLQSVAGMAFALILMNYVSKADELFKKIFNFGGGDSLLGHTENAMQSTMQGIQAAKGLVTGAKPIMNLAKGEVKLAKAGIAGAVGLGAGAVAGATAAVKDIAGAFRKNDSDSDDNTSSHSENQDNENADNGPTPENAEALPAPKPLGKGAQRKADDAALREMGGTQLRQDVEAAKDRLKKLGPPPPKGSKERKKYDREKQAAQQQHLEALQKYSRFQKLTKPSVAANLGGKLKRSIDMENIFETTEGASPKLGTVNDKATFGSVLKHVGGAAVHGARTGSSVMNGRTTFNPRTMSFENSGTKGLLNMYKNFAPSNFFALTDTDKKKMKQMTGTMGKALLGMGSMLVGMGMVVAEPSKGMALIAAGRAGYKKAFGRDIKGSKSVGKYTFSGFGSHSLNTIKNSALVRAKQEHAAMVAQGIKTDYPSLAEKLKSDKASAITIGELSGELGPLFATQNSPYSQVATVAMMEKYNKKKSRFMKNTAIGAQMDDFAKHYAKQQRKQMSQFIQEATDMEQTAIEARIEYRKAKLENGNLTDEQKAEIEAVLEKEKKDLQNIREILEKQGYGVDADGDIVEVKEEDSKEDVFAAVLLAAEKDLEKYKNSDGTVDSKSISKKYDVQLDDMKAADSSKEITQADVDLVNKTIDDILFELSQGKGVELSSEKDFDDVIKKLSNKLAKSGLLKEKQSAEELFKQKREGLKAELKKKAAKRNAAVQATTKKLEEMFTPEGAATMKDVIEDVTRETTAKGRKESEVTVMDVIARLEKTQDGSLQVKSADGSVRASVKDGSRRVAGSDGSQSVGGKNPLNESQVEALQQFMQVTRASKPAAKGEKVDKEKAKRLTEEAAKTARESKLQQAMLAIIGEETTAAVETGSSTQSSTQDILAQLTQRESEYVTATVRDLLELKDLNAETAKLNRDKIQGNSKYKKAVRDESSARIAVATLEREILIEESRTDVTQAEIKSTVEGLANKLKDARDALRKQEATTAMNGPVTDIPDFVRSGFKNNAVEELMGGTAIRETKAKNSAERKKRK